MRCAIFLRLVVDCGALLLYFLLLYSSLHQETVNGRIFFVVFMLLIVGSILNCAVILTGLSLLTPGHTSAKKDELHKLYKVTSISLIISNVTATLSFRMTASYGFLLVGSWDKIFAILLITDIG